MSLRVHAPGRRVTAVRVQIALIYIYTLFSFGFKSRLAFAEIPSWHVNTVRCLLTPVHPGRTLIQILLAGFTDIAGTARTHTGRPAFAPIQTSLIAHRFTVVPVALVARLAAAVIRAGRVDAVRVLVAAVLPGLALVHLDAVELVQLPVAGQTLAHVRTERVDAARVQMAVIAIKTTLLSALVDVRAIIPISVEARATGTRVLGVKIKTRSVSMTCVTL